MMRTIKRSDFVAGTAAAFASIGIVRSPARAAQFSYKYGHDLALDHPVHLRSLEMWDAVRRETGGRLDVQSFGNSQLGNDSAMLAQVRSGAIQFIAMQGLNYSSVIPLAAIDGVGFAFRNAREATAAFDGELGDYVRREIASKGLHPFDRVFDVGFRQITSGTKAIHQASDLNGFKIRTPLARIAVDLFKTLGASPSPINFAEVYTALQTHLVDGQETPYVVIETSKFYEVQKYLNVSNHMWTAFWILGNVDAWNALPADIRTIVERNVRTSVALERADIERLDAATSTKLRGQGLTESQVDASSMRAQLGPYYARWKSEFGSTAWSLLEKTTGKLG